MEESILVQPLPRKTRQRTFFLLIGVFLVVIPLLYLYASGYRLDLRKPTNFVRTGGLSVTVNETGASIYIDGEEVRTARTFRKSFYAQGIDAGTHRLHVQKDGYHTWVKELPVSERLVSEAIAFNLPLVPQVRVISPLQTATGTMVIPQLLTNASSTNEVIATSTKLKNIFTENPEFVARLHGFSTTSTSTEKESAAQQIRDLLQKNEATTTPASEVATTTIVSGGVKLHESGDDLFATWVGSFEEMPYYYCSPDFPRYSTSSIPAELKDKIPVEEPVKETTAPVAPEYVMHPVQTVPKDSGCVPTIRIDRKWQEIRDFDFFPGSTDFVIVVLEDGIYVVEIDDRAWQNVQPLFLGKDLQLFIENNDIYVYDGKLIYQVIAELE